ncbi:MAG: TetR/AcrR family transcriptional regulator [Lewinellaceae bacterium]|nr:TetR/AcrR family transcriptional regulator [Lewinellaceae bacterium]
MEIRQSLINVAYKLFLKYGVKSVSMDDIAGKMGVSKKTIYCVISNKDDLIDTVVEKHILDEREKIESIIQSSENAIDEMVQITKYGSEFMQNMAPTLIMDLQKYHQKTWGKIRYDHLEYFERIISSNVSRGQHEGLYRKNLNVAAVSQFYVVLLLQLILSDDIKSNQYDKAVNFQEIVNYHINSIVTDDGRNYFNTLNF